MPIIVLAPLLALLPMWKIFKGAGDFRKELQITVQETRHENGQIEMLGTVHNSGTTSWDNISVNIDFFNKEGKFIDQETGRISQSVAPQATENFKITIPSPSDRIKEKDVRMELKIADAMSRMF